MTNDKCQMTNVGRIIDANVNRAVEGVRVVEEIARFVIEDKKATKELKEIRSKLRRVAPRLSARQAATDIGGKLYTESEGKRNDLLDVFSANMKRVQEATRVLEEFAKLTSPKLGKIFKTIRFQIYELEKKMYPMLVRQVKPPGR